MPTNQKNRVASFGPTIASTPNRVLDDIVSARGGGVIDAANTRDPSNPTAPEYLLSGMPMGRVTATGKYAPAIIGLGEAYTSAEVALTTTPASAAELLRRVGATGTFRIKGTLAGVVKEEVATYSAIDTGTGVITIADLGEDYDANSLISVIDGSEKLVTIYNGFNEGFPQRMTNEVTGSDEDVVIIPATAAWVLEAGVTFWPTEANLRDNLRAELNVTGQFTFRESFVG